MFFSISRTDSISQLTVNILATKTEYKIIIDIKTLMIRIINAEYLAKYVSIDSEKKKVKICHDIFVFSLIPYYYLTAITNK